MASLEAVREEWRQSVRSRPVHPSLTFTEEGLVLGAGTVLAKANGHRYGRPAVAIDDAEERILTLLAVAYGRAIDPAVLGHIRRASEQWTRGELCLALIHLAYTGLSKLHDEQQASFRLFFAERALANGLTPPHLRDACGLDSTPSALFKAGYNLHQPRVPKGNPDGGQWTSDGDENSAGDAGIVPADYKPVKEPPKNAKIVVAPDGVPIRAGDPPRLLIGPPNADFREVYAAGRAIAPLPYAEQIRRGYAALHHGGTYDFQRDPTKEEVQPAYANASNYAVGVYMAGAGYSLRQTLNIARTYAFFNSSNYGSKEQEDWTTAGWSDATAGRWK
jgi:hypothetical protein